MLLYLILYQLFLVYVSAINDVEVQVFTDYIMPCNIPRLPKTLDSQKFMWFQNGRINRAINEIILSRGEIPFREISPDASGTYMCCYDNSSFVLCAESIKLKVKYPRPEIFLDTVLNTTGLVYCDTVYWLPQMLTTPLAYPEITKSDKLVNFYCFFYVKYLVGRPPVVRWSFNDRLSAGKHFEKRILENSTHHRIHSTEIPCKEEYLKGSDSHCFQSTLTVLLDKSKVKPRTTLYTCYVSASDGYDRNTLSVNYRLGNDIRVIYNLSDMMSFNDGCFGNLSKSQSLQMTIGQLNACERNQFLNLWVSPAKEGNSTVECSRPLFVVLSERLKVMRLPADTRLVEMIAQLECLGSDKLYSSLNKYGQLLLESSRHTARWQDKDIYFYDAIIEGNLSLGCQADQVVVVCTYGPLFQIRLVSTECKPLGRLDPHLYSFVFLTASLPILLIFFTFVWCHRRRNSHQEIVWKTIESYSSSYIVQSRLRTPPLPAPILTLGKNKQSKQVSPITKMEKYLKLDATQWSLSVYKLRLEERIANGSYGDVFCGVLLTPLTVKGQKGDGKMTEKQIVAKVLNDVLSKDEMMEFANEVAILRIIGGHPNIIQFMGCAQRSNLGKQPALIMEYASRGTLLDYLLPIRPNPNTPLQEIMITYWWTRARRLIEDFLSFATDIASALLYLENIAVSHGDIAARNVLLTDTLIAKLGDFGLACVVPHGEFVTLRNFKRIPVRWSAPEVIQSSSRHARSDVWSFGVLLWEIFSFGDTPYAHIDSEEAVGKYVSIEGGRLRRPSVIIDDEDEIYKVMTSCWRDSAEQRPGFQALLERLNLATKGKSDSSASADFGLTEKNVSSQCKVLRLIQGPPLK